MVDPVLSLIAKVEAANYAEDEARTPAAAERHYQRGVAAFERIQNSRPSSSSGAIMLLNHAIKIGADFRNCGDEMRAPVLELAMACFNGIATADPLEVRRAIRSIETAAKLDGAAGVTRCMKSFRAWARAEGFKGGATASQAA